MHGQHGRLLASCRSSRLKAKARLGGARVGRVFSRDDRQARCARRSVCDDLEKAIQGSGDHNGEIQGAAALAGVERALLQNWLVFPFSPRRQASNYAAKSGVGYDGLPRHEKGTGCVRGSSQRRNEAALQGVSMENRLYALRSRPMPPSCRLLCMGDPAKMGAE